MNELQKAKLAEISKHYGKDFKLYPKMPGRDTVWAVSENPQKVRVSIFDDGSTCMNEVKFKNDEERERFCQYHNFEYNTQDELIEFFLRYTYLVHLKMQNASKDDIAWATEEVEKRKKKVS